MAKGNMDQRVRMTRKLLRDALVQQMQTHNIAEISVRSLCEIAEINRSTFYAHYKDPFDLLHQIEKDIMGNLKHHLEQQDYQDNRPVSLQVLIQILEYLKSDADLFRVLVSSNCDIDFQKDIMALSQIVPFQLNHKYDEKDQEYIRIFGITGCISILQVWLQNGTVEPPEKMAKLILRLVYQGMTGFE